MLSSIREVKRFRMQRSCAFLTCWKCLLMCQLLIRTFCQKSRAWLFLPKADRWTLGGAGERWTQSWAGEKQLHSCRIAESFHLPRSQNGTSAQDPPAPQRTSWAPLQGMLSVENSKVVQVQASPSLLPLESLIITIGQEPKVAEMQQSGWLVSRPRFTDRDTEIMWGFRAASSGLRSLTSCAALEDVPALPPPGPRLPPPATRIH